MLPVLSVLAVLPGTAELAPCCTLRAKNALWLFVLSPDGAPALLTRHPRSGERELATFVQDPKSQKTRLNMPLSCSVQKAGGLL